MLHFHQEREREREREREVCGEIWLDSGEGWQLVRPVLGFFKGSACGASARLDSLEIVNDKKKQRGVSDKKKTERL
jgi:hypothetical protein